MVNGLLEVVLVDAAGFGDTECFLGGIDPYVLIKYKREGSKPMWNEKFNFVVQFPEMILGKIYPENLLALGVEKGRAEIHPRKWGRYENEEEFGGWKEAFHLHHRDDDEEE
ncbi:hypothetical protein MKW92_031455 [Papaver armeniacum]|nr:hypothetical protein MKW92_031455 [Papaver armeniacum]